MTSRTSDRSTRLDRNIAAVAADALKDTLSHALLTNSDGIGLRGGSYRTKFTNTGLQLQLHAVRFTRDVAITGRAALPSSRALSPPGSQSPVRSPRSGNSR